MKLNTAPANGRLSAAPVKAAGELGPGIQYRREIE